MSLIPTLAVLLLGQSGEPMSETSRAHLLNEMVGVAAEVDCKRINPVWTRAYRARSGASEEFLNALDNLHARRSRLGCLVGCTPGEDCPQVKSSVSRYADYWKMHERLTNCLAKGGCGEQTIDDLQGALRTGARVLLGEIKPDDPKWTKLVSGFATIVGFDTSAGSLLTMVSHLTPAQRQAIDWQKLSRAIGALIDILPPKEVEAEDAERILRFAMTMLKSGDGKVDEKLLERLGKEWHLVLGILDKLRTPEMRQAADRMLDLLVKRYAGKDERKEKKYRDLQTDLRANSSLDTLGKVVRGLDVAELEEIQRQSERMVLFPAILAEYRAKRLYTTLDLPQECRADTRVKSEHCDAIYAVADQFSQILDGRALGGTSKTAPRDLDEWLAGLENDLTHAPDAPGWFTGVFAGGVGLQIRTQPEGSAADIRAGYLVETLDTDPAEKSDVRFEKGSELRTGIDLARTPDVGKALAEAVLARSTLLKAFDRTYYNTTQMPDARPPILRVPPPNPAWALASAGLPLLDGTNWHRGLGYGLSALDSLALISASVFFVQASSERDAFAAGKSGSLSTADRRYELALNMLVVAGVCKALGVLGGLLVAD